MPDLHLVTSLLPSPDPLHSLQEALGCLLAWLTALLPWPPHTTPRTDFPSTISLLTALIPPS